MEDELRELAERNDDALAIWEALELLPRQRRGAFLRAPIVASRLLSSRYGETFAPVPIAKALSAELVAAGIDAELIDMEWTALGDRQIEPPQWEGAPARAKPLPRTDIVVDHAGPTNFSVGHLSPLMALSKTELARARPLLGRAARGLATESPFAADFWMESIDVVALRTLARPGSSFSSVALRYNARVTLFVNVHVPEVDEPLLADLLLHEAIHSMLFMFEESEGRFVPNYEIREGVSLTSPWSGRQLKLNAFLHACFVWYGVYWFWLGALESNGWHAARIIELRDAARRGFKCRPAQLIIPHRAHISPDVVSLLHELDDRVLQDELQE